MVPPGDVQVTRLKAGSSEEIYTARIGGRCESWPSAMSVSAAGEVSLGIYSSSNFPLHNPVMMDFAANVLARLDDRGNVVFSTYAPWGSTPAVATGVDGTLAAAHNDSSGNDAVVLEVPEPSRAFTVERVANSFTGDYFKVVPGMLFTVTGHNLADSSVDLGLNYPGTLPDRVLGVQVLFDGIPAGILQVTPRSRHLCCARESDRDDRVSPSGPGRRCGREVPGDRLDSEHRGASDGRIPGSAAELEPAGNLAQPVARNKDGTLNGPNNPTAVGETVTLYLTGVADPQYVRLLWASQQMQVQAARVAGCIDGLWEVRVKVPPSPAASPGSIERVIISTYFAYGAGVYVRNP